MGITEQTNTKTDAIKQALSVRYEIRFNSITAKLEFAEIGKQDFAEVSPDLMREFVRELRDNGISATKGDIIKAFNSKAFKRDDTPADEEIQTYIQTILECRFNVIKTRVEYRLYDDRTETWRTLDKYFVNSLVRQIKSYGYKTSRQALTDLFESDFSPKANPIRDYFEELPEVDGDPIGELADTVVTTNPDKWREYLQRWLVATLANVYELERCTNHSMIILCGEQGAYKTTWIENLIPPKLKRYMYSGKLDITNDKDANAYLAENLIVNVDDQMKQLMTDRGYDSIKNITYRRPYDIQATDYPRLASLIGSVNGTDVISDPTGSRRFLLFEVLSIDKDRALAMDISRVWKQALNLYRDGYRYWFTPDEVNELTTANESFAVVSVEAEMLLRYYAPANEFDQDAVFVQTMDIVNFIMGKSPNRQLKDKKIFEALQKYKFVKSRKRLSSGQRIYGYYVKTNFNDSEPFT